MNIEDQSVEGMDEDELVRWAGLACDEISRLRKYERLVNALHDVLEKQAGSKFEMQRASEDFVERS